jgi:hypothetical protein
MPSTAYGALACASYPHACAGMPVDMPYE